MHLLQTKTLELVDAEALQWPRYAILSHRWGDQEVTLQHLRLTTTDGLRPPHVSCMEGYRKIRQFSYLAAHEGFEYGWVDTCCIDKTSSAELSEAINSMFKWYSEAQICYAYLNDVEPPQEKEAKLDDEFFETLSSSQWWQRGWTLQELIAPSRVHFFSRDWTYIGDKSTLGPAITIITGIDQATLDGHDIRRVSIARRMFWASQRTTTRIEDIAYCLLGVFAVNMPLLYGEGEQAFVRLQEEIMKTSDDQSIFAWEDRCSDDDSALFESHSTLLRGPLARSPAEFSNA
ncbi:HET-domain-containing protein [Lizonia empirigonia]|nr:HET-domain-containing protein [Lizonia empirigonia]